MKKEILRMENVYVGIAPPHLLDNFRLRINEGEIVNLMGLSGAGKTLLLNFFNGGVTLQAGRVIWKDKIYGTGERFNPDPRLICLGHTSTLVEKMTVAENILVLSRKKKRGPFVSTKDLIYRAQLLLWEYFPEIIPEMLVAELSPFQKHVVELIRGIENEAQLIVIDDIFQSYGHNEILQMRELLQRLAQKKIAILYESHHEDFNLDISDRIVIMRRGMNVRTFYQTNYSSSLAEQFLIGNETRTVSEHPSYKQETVNIELKNYSCGEKVRKINMCIHHGEVIGLVDRENIANKELALSLVGECEVLGGGVFYEGRSYVPKNIDDAVNRNIGYVPRNMEHVGVVETMSFMDNLFLPVMKKTSRFKIFNDKTVLDYLEKEYLEELGIPAEHRKEKTKAFDGYIRNSILLTRWVLFRPKVLVCIEPHGNADVLMQNIINDSIATLVKQGCSVIISSPYLNDIKPICDRVFDVGEGHCDLIVSGK